MRIVIVDDHPIVRSGVERVISREEDMKVVGTAASCPEGLEVIAAQKPDLAIVDYKIPGGDGFELIRRARKQVSGCRFIMLTSYSSQQVISRATSENVEGFILKEALPEELIAAIRLVARGRRYFDPDTIDDIINRKTKDPFQKLTRREQDIIQALAEGLSNKAIAEKLYISENTVKKHVGNILDKLGLQDRTQAALYAFTHGRDQVEEMTGD